MKFDISQFTDNDLMLLYVFITDWQARFPAPARWLLNTIIKPEFQRRKTTDDPPQNEFPFPSWEDHELAEALEASIGMFCVVAKQDVSPKVHEFITMYHYHTVEAAFTRLRRA